MSSFLKETKDSLNENSGHLKDAIKELVDAFLVVVWVDFEKALKQSYSNGVKSQGSKKESNDNGEHKKFNPFKKQEDDSL